jgi:hypothetical protein
MVSYRVCRPVLNIFTENDERRRWISTLAVPLPPRVDVGSDPEFGAKNAMIKFS